NLHNLRMLRQVVMTGFSISLFMGFVTFAGLVYYKTPRYAYHQMFQYWKAECLLLLTPASREHKVTVQFLGPNGILYKRLAQNIVNDPIIAQNRRGLANVLYHSLNKGLKGIGVTSILLLLFWMMRGLLMRQYHHRRGSSFISPNMLRRRLWWSRKASDLKLDTAPLSKGKETAHMLITGTTGSGKTNAFHTLLPQIRKRGDRAIVVDLTGDLVSKYYREGYDLLLNPLDARSLHWDLWKDCTSLSHYDALSESIIPGKGTSHDPFWDEASRTLFRIAVQKLQEQNLRDPHALYTFLTSSDMKTFQNFFEGTEASSYTNKDGEKTTLSVRANLATHLSSFKYLNKSENGFSLREWIKNPHHKDQWLFLSALPDQRKTLRPLISAWLDLSINALMSASSDPKRRLWFVMDELPALQRLPSLKTGLAELRKYGGCILAGLQSIPQLEEIYGKAASQNMLNLFNTFLFFRNNDPTTSQWISKVLGEREQQEIQENLSYGAHAMRDGVSLNPTSKTTPLVLPTEIGSLQDLEAYLKLPGSWPITKLKMRYKNLKGAASPFIENTPCYPLNRNLETVIVNDSINQEA
ncbi:MAG: type IV conjugative transfer system coupling protein TraD, partial [Alphaproteobacteria bacterium]|nr:type IV conjugative transfer system coupling protein TraD [Alphaproteobacteria bacterium]